MNDDLVDEVDMRTTSYRCFKFACVLEFQSEQESYVFHKVAEKRISI